MSDNANDRADEGAAKGCSACCLVDVSTEELRAELLRRGIGTIHLSMIMPRDPRQLAPGEVQPEIEFRCCGVWNPCRMGSERGCLPERLVNGKPDSGR